jgi:hypothetical protein
MDERIKIADSRRLVNPELLATSIVADSDDERRNDLAVTDIHHTMGKLTEVLHKAMQHLLRALGQCQKVIKGSRALVPALEHINELLAQVFP